MGGTLSYINYVFDELLNPLLGRKEVLLVQLPPGGGIYLLNMFVQKNPVTSTMWNLHFKSAVDDFNQKHPKVEKPAPP